MKTLRNLAAAEFLCKKFFAKIGDTITITHEKVIDQHYTEILTDVFTITENLRVDVFSEIRTITISARIEPTDPASAWQPLADYTDGQRYSIERGTIVYENMPRYCYHLRVGDVYLGDKITGVSERFFFAGGNRYSRKFGKLNNSTFVTNHERPTHEK